MNIFEDGLALNLSGMLNDILPIAGKILLLIIAYSIVKPIGNKMIRSSIHNAGRTRKISNGRAKTLEKLLINLFSYVLLFIFILMLFATFNAPIGPLLASAGVIGLAIGFGAQGLVSDVVTGFFILLERQLEIDDYVTTAGYDGVVEEVGLRTTKIRSFDGTLNYVPNRLIEGVANHTRGNMRALVDIGISYDSNMDEAITVLEEVCRQYRDDERFKEGPDVLGVQAIDSSSVVLRVLGQTENGMQWACERDMRKSIKEALNAANITIPYPHQVFIEESAK
ncbi:putative MscS family protein YkuT [Lentibacillus sp. JNUCC-1]|uniref:mechanosensitive ion channel family protein n=1 Tax=Lentibacillus sp. JNUCC-1 TaxID=2654513 RepID=UPI0012E83915|nr:mechanosensitive ion channel family protein [Lentibacillus sp. JNUCC-1]MUV36285.1 putative MscS family protein YkuT [Lentibacillus sp. JNUCC-1]